MSIYESSIEDLVSFSNEQQKQIFDIINHLFENNALMVNRTDSNELGISLKRLRCLEILNSYDPPAEFSFDRLTHLVSVIVSFVDDLLVNKSNMEHFYDILVSEYPNTSKDQFCSFVNTLVSFPAFPKLVFRVSRPRNSVSNISVHHNEIEITEITEEPIIYPIYDVYFMTIDSSNYMIQLDEDELKELALTIENTLKSASGIKEN